MNFNSNAVQVIVARTTENDHRQSMGYHVGQEKAASTGKGKYYF